MSFLKLNGYTIPVISGVETRWVEAGSRGRSPNNTAFVTRTGALKRQWSFRTVPMIQADAQSLMQMLMQSGDWWRFDTASLEGISTTDADLESDKGLAAESTPIYTVIATKGKDGSPVYDENGVLYAPHEDVSGVLWVAPATTNIISAANADPDASGDLSAVIGGTLATETTRKWRGAGCVKVTAGATNDGAKTGATAAASATTYVGTVHVKGDAGGESINVTLRDDGPSNTAVGFTLVGGTDSWNRLAVTHTTHASATTIQLEITSGSGAQVFYVDGLQIEAQTSKYTPWVAGTASRALGVCTFPDNLVTAAQSFSVGSWIFTKKETTAFGMIINAVDPAVTKNIFTLRLDTFERPELVIWDDNGNTDSARWASALTDDTWYFIVGTYDFVANTAKIYVNGDLKDTSTALTRKTILANIAAGSIGIGDDPGGASTSAGPQTGAFFVPYAMSANAIAGIYDSGSATRPAPGLFPLTAQGDFIPAEEASVQVHGSVRRGGQLGVHRAGTWGNNNQTVEFILEEV